MEQLLQHVLVVVYIKSHNYNCTKCTKEVSIAGGTSISAKALINVGIIITSKFVLDLHTIHFLSAEAVVSLTTNYAWYDKQSIMLRISVPVK